MGERRRGNRLDFQWTGLDNESSSVASRAIISSFSHFLYNFLTRRSRLWWLRK